MSLADIIGLTTAAYAILLSGGASMAGTFPQMGDWVESGRWYLRLPLVGIPFALAMLAGIVLIVLASKVEL